MTCFPLSDQNILPKMELQCILSMRSKYQYKEDSGFLPGTIVAWFGSCTPVVGTWTLGVCDLRGLGSKTKGNCRNHGFCTILVFVQPFGLLNAWTPAGFPDPCADPKSRSTSRFYNLHHRSTGVLNWGFYFLDPPGGLGSASPCLHLEPRGSERLARGRAPHGAMGGLSRR